MVFLESICTNYDFLRIVHVIYSIFKFVCLVVPILLVLMGVLDFSKAAISSSEENMKKSLNIFIKRVIYCIGIFLIPFIVSGVMNLLSDLNVDFASCITNSESDKIEQFKGLERDSVKGSGNSIFGGQSGSVSGDGTNNGNGSSTGSNGSGSKNGSGSSAGNNGKGSKSGNGSSDSNGNNGNGSVATKITLNKNFVVIDNSHFNNSSLKATVTGSINDKKVIWKSSNSSIVTVNSNGLVKAVAGKYGKVVITATTSDGKTAKCNVMVIRQMYQSGGKWMIDSKDFTNQEKEAYINNAEELCHSGNISNYPECGAGKFPYYVNGTTSNIQKRYLNKNVGISATKYLVFTSSIKQTITLMEKKGSTWKVVHSWKTSTGKAMLKGAYRFDFYYGVRLKADSYGCGTLLAQFWQTQTGSWTFKSLNGPIKEPHCASRAIHNGDRLADGGSYGYPASAGCLRMKCADYKILDNQIKNYYGTRIIVY